MNWLLCIIIGALSSFWLFWRYKKRRMLAMANKIPGPPTIPFLGNALRFICQPDEFIKEIKSMRMEYGDVFRFWLGPDLNVVVNNPDDIKILLTNTKTNAKGPQYKYMVDVLGGGILSGSGPTWRKHRKIANPNYGKRAIESYSDVFNKEADLLMEILRKQTNKEINIYEPIVRVTSHSVCQTLMGLTKEQTVNLPYIQDIIDDSPKIYDIAFERMTKWYLQIDPVFWMTNNNKAQNYFNKMTAEFSTTILNHRAERLKSLNGKQLKLMDSDADSKQNTQLSVIDRFILSNELNAQELVHETFTIFTSSQEASAKIASYIILMMAYYPKCQEKLYSEIKSILGDEERPVTDQDLKRMPYLEMVFKEVLRLFPIGAMLQRTISEDIAISSCTLPAGCSMVVPIYHLHRDPMFWTNPEYFDPDRFTPENTKRRNPNAYIPFSTGPMDCLGRYFGTKLIKTVAVRVLQEFKVTSPETYDDLRVAISISVVSLNGYPVILHPRKFIHS